jgi:hypothetical protein
MDMLCVMAEADGYLLVGDKPPDDDLLARIISVGVDDLRAAVAELEANHVFSRNSRGVIYSRRMVRDEKRRQTGRETGPLAQQATTGKDRQKPATPQGSPGTRARARAGFPESRGRVEGPKEPSTPSLTRERDEARHEGASSLRVIEGGAEMTLNETIWRARQALKAETDPDAASEIAEFVEWAAAAERRWVLDRDKEQA